MVRIRNKGGQISIFVIVALGLVVAIALVFFIFRSPEVSLGGDFDDPQGFIENCIRGELRDTIDVMTPQGGFVDPGDYVLYNDIQVTYLCKNINYYEPCITQYPRYVTQLQEEVEINIKEEIEQCFILFESELDNRNYVYSGGDIEINVTLKPESVETTVFRDFSFSKNDVTRVFDSLTVAINSPLYDLAHVANEIASQEAKFCYFENLGYNLLYQDFDIRKDTLSDSTKIYTIEYEKTGDIMNIAIRGCAIPAGF